MPQTPRQKTSKIEDLKRFLDSVRRKQEESKRALNEASFALDQARRVMVEIEADAQQAT